MSIISTCTWLFHKPGMPESSQQGWICRLWFVPLALHSSIYWPGLKWKYTHSRVLIWSTHDMDLQRKYSCDKHSALSPSVCTLHRSFLNSLECIKPVGWTAAARNTRKGNTQNNNFVPVAEPAPHLGFLPCGMPAELLSSIKNCLQEWGERKTPPHGCGTERRCSFSLHCK